MKSRIREGGGLLARYIKSLYAKRLARLSEHSYCAALLRGEYPYVAELFNALAASDTEMLGELGELLCSVGIDPVIDVRIRGQGCRSENIDRTIASELDRLRGDIDELERIHSITDEPRVCEAAEKMRLLISENIKIFERILQS